MIAQALLFVAGAIIGTALDRIHVVAGVLSYVRPVLAGQAVWVPLVFGVGGMVMVNGHRLFRRDAAAAPPARSLVLPALAFVTAYVATAVARDTPAMLAAGLVLAWISRLVLHPSGDRVAAGLALALGGPLVEAGLSATGGFHYTRPDLLGVPIWLPALYLHASLLTRQIDLVFRPRLAPTSCRRS